MTTNQTASHEKTFNIAWGDMDALGHVNNVHYFDYFQEARLELLMTLNLTLIEKEGPVLIHAACTFLKPVVYPATVSVRTKIHSLGHSSLIMDHDLYQDEVLMAQGHTKLVWVNYEQNKSVPLPDVIRQLCP